MKIPNTPIVVDDFAVRPTKSCRCAPPLTYFLTHLHQDHTNGLTPSWNHGIIYCSPTTRLLCLEKFKLRHSAVLHELEVGQTSLVYLDREYTVSINVTALPAYHCPGAVMFLFEGYFGRILHTGDFRFDHPHDQGSMLFQHLKLDSYGKLDHVFVDNTYCAPSNVFRSRKDAADLLVEALKLYPDTTRVLVGIDTLGKEELIFRIGEALESLVHVSNTRFEALKVLGLAHLATTNASEARISVVSRREITMSNAAKWGWNTIGVLASAFGGIAQDFESSFSSCEITCQGDLQSLKHRRSLGPNDPMNGLPKLLHVRYSLHCSYAELKEFLARVPSREVHPCSIHSPEARVELRKLVAESCSAVESPSRDIKLPMVFSAMADGRCRCGDVKFSDQFGFGAEEDLIRGVGIVISKRKRTRFTTVRRTRHQLGASGTHELGRRHSVPIPMRCAVDVKVEDDVCCSSSSSSHLSDLGQLSRTITSKETRTKFASGNSSDPSELTTKSLRRGICAPFGLVSSSSSGVRSKVEQVDRVITCSSNVHIKPEPVDTTFKCSSNVHVKPEPVDTTFKCSSNVHIKPEPEDATFKCSSNVHVKPEPVDATFKCSSNVHVKPEPVDTTFKCSSNVHVKPEPVDTKVKRSESKKLEQPGTIAPAHGTVNHNDNKLISRQRRYASNKGTQQRKRKVYWNKIDDSIARALALMGDTRTLDAKSLKKWQTLRSLLPAANQVVNEKIEEWRTTIDQTHNSVV